MIATYICKCGARFHTDIDIKADSKLACRSCGHSWHEAEKIDETPQIQLGLFDDPVAKKEERTVKGKVVPTSPPVLDRSNPDPEDKKAAALAKIEQIVTEGSKDF